MEVDQNTLGRISKLLIDRHDLSIEEAATTLKNFRLLVRCGPELQASATLQAALLTLVNIANRCFDGSIRVQGAEPWPLRVAYPGARFLTEAVVDLAGSHVLDDADDVWQQARAVSLGTTSGANEGVQLTFDGWTAAVSTLAAPVRLPEREGCILAGVAAGALAVSELFLGNFGFDFDAAHRCTGLSLWRPDLDWQSTEANGVSNPLKFLPKEAWLIGLGHLGQAFAWTIGLLPYADRRDVQIVLQDFDRLVPANWDTGLLTRRKDIEKLKTRVVGDHLESLGFQPRYVERRFDEHLRLQRNDPRVALVGMDGQGPRHLLDGVGFDTVIDCGLGGTSANFDSISLFALPQTFRTAAQIWQEKTPDERDRLDGQTKQLAGNRKAYADYQSRHACGHVELAGRAVAVPFVGAMAAALAIAELLRRIVGGPEYESIYLQLASADHAKTRNHLLEGERRRPRPAFELAQ